MLPADEIVTIVDAHNNVVGSAPRWEMRAKRLPHRSTYILVFNSQGELFVQKRTMTKDVFPGYYDPATGGVVLAGES
jgi:isopentenyldiphosphate isomerase